MPTLLVVLPAVPVQDGKVGLSSKTITGMTAIAERWPGRVVAAARTVVTDPSQNLGIRWCVGDEFGWELLLGDPAEALEKTRPTVVQLPLHRRERPLLRKAPCVVVAENPSFEMFKYASASVPRTDLPRMALGAVRQAYHLRQMARAATALACNGWAAWEAYASRAVRDDQRRTGVPSILFFDNRLTASAVRAAAARTERRTGPPRLAFSGRLHPAKGPQFAVGASNLLRDQGFEHTLTLFGVGPMEEALRRDAHPGVTFVGDVDFEKVWIDAVSTGIDLMVLPHTQGDPSGTYVEAAGLGKPVLGLRNAALSGHAKHAGFALTCAHSERALADLIQSTASDAPLMAHLRAAGLDFMSRHHVEAEFDARVEQLLAVAWHHGT